MTTRDIVAADRRVQYSGSSGLGPYSFAFQLNATSELAVYIDSTLKTETTHYTVTLAAAGSGSITFASGQGPTALQTVTLVSNVPITRTSVYSVAGSLTAASLENDFDTNRIIAQQINEKAERSLHAPEHDPDDINMELPAKADRLSKVLQFDSNGEPIAVASLTDSATTSTPGLMSTADKVKLDGIATGADVTTASRVNAVGAVMNTDTSTAPMQFVVDEDNMASNSATKLPTQQSVKAYVDSQVESKDALSELSGDLDDISDGSSHVKMTNAERTKLTSVETGATADQTDAQIKTAYENNANTNAFTNAEQTKLSGIEANATADQTDAEIKTAYENNSDTNAFTDAEKTKLTGIETGATGDQTASEILTAIKTVDGTASGLDADLLDGQQGSYYQPASTALTTSTSFAGDVSGTYNAIVIADDSHNHIISNVDGLQTALDAKAPLASPALTGTPTAPTAAADTSTTQIATTAFVQQELAELIDTAPSTLDTLNEIAAAINDDANFNTTVTNSLANRVRVDTASQGLTSTQQSNARTNLGLTTSEIFTEIKTVDGSGTGLDSDLLDGQHGSHYLDYNNFTNVPTLTTTLTALTDTTITSVSDNDLIAYDSTSSKFINQTPAEAGFATVATSGAYSDLSGTPTIPSSTSDLTNDSGFITSTLSGNLDLNGNQLILDADGDTYISAASDDIIRFYLSNSQELTLTIGALYPSTSNGLSLGATFNKWNTVYATTGRFTNTTVSDQMTSTVATGTAPLVIDSTTKVANLNVDKLDDQEGSYYLDYTNFTNTPTIPTAVSDLTNDSGFITSVPAQSFASLTGKPTTISGYGITDAFDGAYSSLTGTPTIPSNTSDLTNDSGFITSADGGNAQTLDSLDSTQFLRSDAADTKTSGDLHFSDNVKATFGDTSSPDLEIYHDGTRSYIQDSGDGDLRIIGGGQVQIRNVNDTKSMANFFSNGKVELKHDGSTILETTSTGAQITGDLTLTGTDDGAGSTPELKLVRQSASPADFDYVGGLAFFADNSADENIEFSTIEARLADATDGTEDFSGFEFFGIKGGTARQRYLGLDLFAINIYNDQPIIYRDITSTHDLRIIPPSSLSSAQDITLPDASGTVLLNTGDQSITGDLTLTSTDDGATEDPTLKLYRNSSSPTGGDHIGHIQFTGNNASGTEIVLAEIETVLGGTTAGSEEGRMKLKVNDGGTETTVIEIGYDRVQFNEAIMINNGRQLGFEGANVDAFETSLRASEPTQDNTITLPDASGTVLLDTGDQTITGDLTLTSTDAGATENPSLDLYRNSASPAVNDVLGHITFTGENSAGEKVQYGELQAKIVDATDGTEDGNFTFNVLSGGVNTTILNIKGDGNTTFNNKDVLLNAVNLIFEGSTADANETTLTVTDPTADRTITLPDQSGEVILVDDREVEIDGNINIVSTSDGSEQNPYFTFYRNSASPASGDNLGIMHFKGKNSAAEDLIYGRIISRLSDATDGSEDGTFEIGTISNGQLSTNIRVDASSSVGIRLLNGGERNIRFDTGTAFDNNHIDLTPASATGSRTITLPDLTGTLPVFTTAPTGAIADGTNGQVLTTNGSGTLSFTTVSGGGSTPVYFDAYKSSADQTFTTGTITVDFNTARQNSDATIFSNSSGEITVSDTGVFKIEYSVVVGVSSGTVRSEARLVLEKKPSGGSFAEVAGTASFTYNRQEFQDSTTASISIMDSVTSGDTYRVRVARNSGTSTLRVATNQARFNFLKID